MSMEMMLVEALLPVASHAIDEATRSLSPYSPITVVGGGVFVAGVLGFAFTRWAECLVIFLAAFAYAAIPFIVR